MRAAESGGDGNRCAFVLAIYRVRAGLNWLVRRGQLLVALSIADGGCS